MPGGFQTQVQNQPAQAVAGDFASANPRAIFPPGPGGFVAGLSGVTVGLAVWKAPPTDPDGTDQILNNFGAGNITGLVYNDTQGLNTVFLSNGSMVIPQGLPVAVLQQGDIWVKNDGTGEALPGQKAYANIANGKLTFAATASTTQAASVTGSIAAASSTFTASISGDLLTVTAVANGTLTVGTTVSGTGVASGTLIAQQLTGTVGGVGTYLLSQAQQQNVASETMTGAYGLLTVTVVGSGALVVGAPLAGSGGGGVTANTIITAQLTGPVGGTGTYVVSPSQTVTSTTITQTGNVETPFTAISAAQPGGLLKVSSWVGSQLAG
jgi:hypothetical protein